MQILFLLTQDLESPSGLGRYLPLACGLSKLGHTAEIVALHSNFSALIEKNFIQNGIKVQYVAPMHVIKTGNEKRYYSSARLAQVAFRATLALSQAAWTTPANIVLIAKPHPMNSLAGLLAGLRGRCVVLDCDDYESGAGHFKRRWQRWSVAFFERNIPRIVRAVTTNTRFMQQKLQIWGVPPPRIFYLPNGVVSARFRTPDPARVAVLRQAWDLIGKKVIAFIGTVSLVSHPVNLLVDAFAEIVRTHPDVVLLLVGGGEDVARVKHQAEDLGVGAYLRWVGRVSPEEVVNYYALADVSVDPVYDNEAARGRSPLKMFESWACGVPFVTADVGERRRALGNPPAGILAQAGDAHALAEAIQQGLGEAEGARLRALGLAQVQEFEWDRLAVGVAEFYQHVLDEMSWT